MLQYCVQVKQKSDSELTKETPYLTHVGDQRDVYCEYFG